MSSSPRLTVEAIAPVIDTDRRPASQPLGTWMSRWHAIYLAPLGRSPLCEAEPVTVRHLPRYVTAA